MPVAQWLFFHSAGRDLEREDDLIRGSCGVECWSTMGGACCCDESCWKS